MNKKNILRIIVSLLSFLLLSSGMPNKTYGQTTTKVAENLSGIFSILETSDWSSPDDTLRHLDQLVIRATNDRSLRNVLEQRFIRLLQESSNRFALQYACRQLYLIGTERSVPALASWLGDPDLSHMARYALASIDDPSTLSSLRTALGKADGKVRAGIILSIGEKGDPVALQDLLPLVESDDQDVALAAISSIGELASYDEISLLKEISRRGDVFHRSAYDAILKIAERMTGKDDENRAAKIYDELYRQGETPNIRMAGLKGMMVTSDSRTDELLLSALSGEDDEIRGFAGRLISDPSYPLNTERLSRRLKKLPDEGKIVLIDALGARNAKGSLAEILPYGDDGNAGIRRSVVRAAGYLGSRDQVAFLAGKAASDTTDIQSAALVSLSQLSGDGVNDEIVRLLPNADSQIQVPLIATLMNRSCTDVKKMITGFLNSPDGEVREAALDYFRALGNTEDLDKLIAFYAGSADRSEKRLTSRCINSICMKEGATCEQVILKSLRESNDNELKAVLLENLNLINTPEALESVIQYASNPDPELQMVSIRALSNWQDSTAMAPLKKIMTQSPDQRKRILAFRGYLRLFRQSKINDRDKMREYATLILHADRKEEKIMVLSAFQEIQSIDALKRVERYLYDPDLSHLTCLTLLHISDFLDPKYKSDIAIAMMQVQAVSQDETVLADVQRRFAKFSINPALYFDQPGTVRKPFKKRIVFISGPMDHAWYNFHEYPKDLLFLKKCIENSPDMQDVRVDFYLTDDTVNMENLRGADAIVVHSSADRAPGEVHALFPNYREDKTYTPAEVKYYAKLDSMVDQGTGMMVLHYAVWTDAGESRKYMTKWVGGYYDDNISKVRMDSVPTRLDAPEHPVNNGVHPWELMEEYYINQVYDNKAKKFTSLISAKLPLNKNDPPDFHTVGWSIERKDGGRGIGFTGCHTHSHLYQDDYRKFIINAIAWTAGIKIPEGGIRTSIPEGW